MTNYFKDKVLTYSTLTTLDNNIVNDYHSFNKTNFLLYATVCDQTYFAYKYIAPDDNLQRISLELYNTPDFWDVLLLLNEYNPLFDIVFDYDIILNSTEEMANTYNAKYFNGKLPQNVLSNISEKYQKDLYAKNEINRILKYIKPDRITDFINNGRMLGYF